MATRKKTLVRHRRDKNQTPIPSCRLRPALQPRTNSRQKRAAVATPGRVGQWDGIRDRFYKDEASDLLKTKGSLRFVPPKRTGLGASEPE